MDVETFVSELDARNRELLRRLAPEETVKPEGDVTVGNLLRVALKNEIEASEIAARWMGTTREPPVDRRPAARRRIAERAVRRLPSREMLGAGRPVVQAPGVVRAHGEEGSEG